MIRRARNKYRNLKKKYIALEKEYNNYRNVKAFCEQHERRDVVNISSLLPDDNIFFQMYPYVSDEERNKIAQNELVKKISKFFIENPQLMKEIPCSLGKEYMITVVVPKKE